MSDELYLRGRFAQDLSKVELENPGIVARIVPSNFIGRDLIVTIKPLEETRSVRQNNWLWGIAYRSIIAWNLRVNGVKVTKDQVHAHNMMKIQGFVYETKQYMGEEVLVLNAPSSSAWTKKQFSEAKDKLQDYYAELGLYIPDPDPDKITFDTDSYLVEYLPLCDDSAMPFGPYAGTPMIEVPAKYLRRLYESDRCTDLVRQYIIDAGIVNL